jgi:chromosome segregation ATPase
VSVDTTQRSSNGAANADAARLGAELKAARGELADAAAAAVAAGQREAAAGRALADELKNVRASLDQAKAQIMTLEGSLAAERVKVATLEARGEGASQQQQPGSAEMEALRSRAEASAQALTRAAEERATAVRELQQQIDKLRVEARQAQTKADELGERNEALEVKVTMLTKDLASAKDEIGELNRLRTSTRPRVGTALREAEEVAEKRRRELDEAKKELLAAQATAEELREKLQAADSSRAQLTRTRARRCTR